MEGYIEEGNWKQILEFIKSVKGIHSKDEKYLRILIEVVRYLHKVVVSIGSCRKSMAIIGAYINDLRGSAKGVFGRVYCSTLSKSQI